MLVDTTLDLLRFESFPLLAGAVAARTEEVLARWQQVVKEKLPTADELTITQLRDELPEILKELAKAIGATDGSHIELLKTIAEGHGQLRFHQSYNIGELLIEYGILRSILIDEVVTHLGRSLTVAESASLHMGIDMAVRNGVTRFTLFQQQQMKAVVDAQSKNLSFLSHDIRGGLNGVLLMCEVLKRELASEPRFKESIADLDSMRQSILDTVSTMDRFLHAERFRQGKVQPHNTTLLLSTILGDLLMMNRHQAEVKKIKLEISSAKHLTAYTDRDLLLLILQNLVSNAIKYTTTGGVRIKAEEVAEGKHRILVIDTGPGISPEVQAKLFEPYLRGETHGQDGVGLGLTIAKQAADLIGAKIHVESTVGTGSTFFLELEQA